MVSRLQQLADSVHPVMRRAALLLALGVTALATRPLAGAPLAGQAPAPAKNDYSRDENWLCRPGRADACAVDLTTTVIAANGALTREPWQANPAPLIDCFYVYPTISRDTTANSDMIPGPEERSVAAIQFARFGSQCRLFAPMYRQVTLTALFRSACGSPMVVDRVLAYTDVLDAWNYYLQHVGIRLRTTCE
jgi:hypothetical protein